MIGDIENNRFTKIPQNQDKLNTESIKTKKPPHFCNGFAPPAGLEPATL